jgi:hypothetical protein
LASAPDSATGQIHADRAVLDFTVVFSVRRLRRNPACTPENRVDTGNEFSNAEGLGQVVVSAYFEPYDTIHFLTTRRKHYHGNIRFTPQPPENFKSVDVRQIDIEQDKFWSRFSAQLDTIFSGLGRAEIEAFLGKRLAKKIGHFAIIVDYQDSPHSLSIERICAVRAIGEQPWRGGSRGRHLQGYDGCPGTDGLKMYGNVAERLHVPTFSRLGPNDNAIQATVHDGRV